MPWVQCLLTWDQKKTLERLLAVLNQERRRRVGQQDYCRDAVVRCLAVDCKARGIGVAWGDRSSAKSLADMCPDGHSEVGSDGHMGDGNSGKGTG